MEASVSGVGVLDKDVRILDAMEGGARSLAELVEVTGLNRATAHRLAGALCVHGLVERDGDGRYRLGLRLGRPSLAQAAMPALAELREATGESVQLYLPQGERRVCVVSLESPHS
ncbi:MAG: helix-turn-helix domain-containing protein, partial [Acidimicrobiales bacterium]